MTSKEVQKMIIDVENDIERFGGMIQFYYQLNILRSYKQDLERLEKLEMFIKILKRRCFKYHLSDATDEEYEFLRKVLEDDN